MEQRSSLRLLRPAKQEAKNKLTRALEAASKGNLTEPTRLTVGAYLERWLEETARPRVRPLTYAGYKLNIRHINRELGSIRLNRLTPMHVQALMNKKLKSGLNAKTVAYIRQVLRTALNDALRWNLVSQNVATLVSAPRQEQAEIHPLLPEELATFLAAARRSKYEALYVTTLALGLREGEGLSLKWEDIDLESATLRVQRQQQRFEVALHFVEPKTRQARRALNIPADVVDLLRAHRKLPRMARLNSDTKREAVADYLAHVARRGVEVPWRVTTSQRGTMTKVAYRSGDLPGWYCYLAR